MADNNQFKPYRYNQSTPRDQGLNLSASRNPAYTERNGGFLRNPAVLAGIGVVCLAFLSFVLVSALTGNDENESGDVPIVQAQADAVKTQPEGDSYRFPNSDSTIYDSASLEDRDSAEGMPENSDPAETVDTATKLELLARQAEARAEALRQAAEEAPESPQDIEVTTAPVTVESTPPQTKEPLDTPTATQKTYAPGASPETLAFVRSVLEQKDQKAATKQKPAPTPEPETISKPTVIAKAEPKPAPKVSDAYSPSKIEPAAGTEGIIIKPGSYYVQLASVKSQPGANTEWGKLKAKYNDALKDSNYRVSRADLDKGTFYRIQAGPMSKESAQKVCSTIKGSSGSCFVTQ
jgi:hypothetical protein